MERSAEQLGYEIESLDPSSGWVDFINGVVVTDRAAKIVLNRDEVLVGLNDPEQFVLALVGFVGSKPQLDSVRPRPGDCPAFEQINVALDVVELLENGEEVGR